MIKKMFSVIIALLLLLGVFAACADKGGNNDTKGTASNSVSSESTSEDIKADLPELKLQGAEWCVFAVESEVKGSFYVDEPDPEVVSEAVYRTMCNVEDRFDCDIIVEYSGVVATDHQALIKNMRDSGETRYSMVELHDAIGSNTALEGYFCNLYDIPYLSFTTPWWHGAEELTVNGKLYMIDTDMSIVSLKNAWMIFFNKDIMKDLGIPYPYETVINGSWTLEELEKITKNVYADLNKNNEIDKDDMYGFHCMESMYGWMDSFDVKTIVQNNEGMLEITTEVDKIQGIVDKMYSFLKSGTGAQTSGTVNWVDTDGFKSGHYMMFHHVLGQACDQFRYEDNLNYGILPSPKYDEKQKSYYTSCLTYPFWVPSNLSEEQLEVAGAVIEALSYEGYKNTLPAYYETALKKKFNPDEESSKMIEIIHDGLRPSFSWCYGNFGQVFYFTLYDMFTQNSTDFSAYYDSKHSEAQARIDTLNNFLGAK